MERSVAGGGRGLWVVYTVSRRLCRYAIGGDVFFGFAGWGVSRRCCVFLRFRLRRNGEKSRSIGPVPRKGASRSLTARTAPGTTVTTDNISMKETGLSRAG